MGELFLQANSIIDIEDEEEACDEREEAIDETLVISGSWTTALLVAMLVFAPPIE